ncbi:MAG: high-potential iron-sulfur protein [Novosphingobium sp.]|nr:high-potential iron-sulfur protein [Novosphingobium sp.]
MTIDRRKFVTLIGAAPLAIASASALAAACVDPSALSVRDKSRRRSLGYEDPSTQAGKRCELCAFFSASTSGCGECQMLTGGTVSAAAVCRSYAAKKK